MHKQTICDEICRGQEFLSDNILEPSDQGDSFSIPGDRPHYLRDRVVDVTHIKVTCRFSLKDKSVAGAAELTLVALTPAVRRISLDCADTWVTSVTCGSSELKYEHVGDELSVALPKALNKGQQLVVKVTYVATPQKGLYFTGPDKNYPKKPTQVWTQGQDTDNHHWFPCIDEPKGRLTSEIVCTVPADWKVISNGRLVSTERINDEITFHWLQDKPHAVYLITLVAGDFERVILQEEGTVVDLYCEPGREDDAQRAFGNTPAMLKLFEQFTGEPYPWDKYSQVAVQDFIFGGMENTSATTQTDLVLHDEKAHQDFSADFLAAHEAAHQWFGDLITCKEWPHGWLNEGFATFLEALWERHYRGEDEYAVMILTMSRSYLGEAYRRPIVERNYSAPTDIFDRHLYEKGGLVLHMLCQELGEELFTTAVKHYVASNKGRNVTTHDFIHACEEATGRSLQWFFDQWIYRAGHPEFSVSYSWESPRDDSNRGVARVSVKQTQKGLPFHGSVKVVFYDKDGQESVHDLKLDSTVCNLSVKMENKPRGVMFDALYAMLKTCKFKRERSMLIHQLHNASTAYARIDAAHNLLNETSPEAAAALEKTMNDDACWGVQAACAKALGEMRTPASKQALMRAHHLPNLKARRAVASALGNFCYDDEVAKVLKSMLSDGESYYVSATAATALGGTRLPAMLPALKEALQQDSHMNVIRSGALTGLAQLRSEEARSVALEWTRPGVPQRVRASAAGALGKLGYNHLPTAEHLEILLDEDWFQLKIAATRALQTLAFAESVPALNRLASRDLDDRVVRTARLAVKSIQTGRTPPEQLKTMEERIEKAAQKNAELSERLSKLEEKSQS